MSLDLEALSVIQSGNPFYMMLLVMMLGGSINIAYTLMNMHWANTSGQRCIAFLLPLLIFVITISVASNIALALGMIGALSIVRFRNPVKSAFELVTFFSFIVIGISAWVSYQFALIVWFATIAVPLVNKLILRNRFKQFSDSEEIEATKIILTCRLKNIQNTFDQFLERNQNILNSFYQEKNELEDNHEITFSLETMKQYSEVSTELEECAEIVNSSIQRY